MSEGSRKIVHSEGIYYPADGMDISGNGDWISILSPHRFRTIACVKWSVICICAVFCCDDITPLGIILIVFILTTVIFFVAIRVVVINIDNTSVSALHSLMKSDHIYVFHSLCSVYIDLIVANIGTFLIWVETVLHLVWAKLFNY